MKYFPSEIITYKTKLTKEEVLERIKKEITPLYLHQAHAERFNGVVIGDTFSLKQVNTRSTSFLPTITGIVIADGSSSIVTLNLTLTKFIQAFAGFFIVMMAIQFVIAVTQIRSINDVGGVLFMLAFSGAFAFGLLKLIGVGFKIEADKIYADFFIVVDAESFEKK
jgi:hypothetical protein